MRLSEGVEWGIHAAALLALVPPPRCVSAARLAEYHGIPGPYLAKHLQAMTRAGVLESVSGPAGGFRLARPATQVTVLDVVEAIDGTDPAFECTEIRRRGPYKGLPRADFPLPCSIHQLMLDADDAWRSRLRGTTIADIVLEVTEVATPRLRERAVGWFTEVMT